MVKIRLTRTGRKNLASYRIVITNAREKRDSKFIEYIGFFNPHTKTIEINKERAQYWLSVGAQPTDRVKFMFIKEGLVKKPENKKVYSKKPGKNATEKAKTAAAAK